MIRKMISTAIVVMMLSVSLAVAVSTGTVAEDVTKGFTSVNAGYPLPTESLDQSQPTPSVVATLDTTYWVLQTFKPSVSGMLSKISFFGALAGGMPGDEMHFGIWDTDQAGQVTAEITDEVLDYYSISSVAQWQDVYYSSPPTLTANTEYAIMFWIMSSLQLDLYYSIPNPYQKGVYQYSTDYGGYWYQESTLDVTFMTYMMTGGGGLCKVAWHSSGDYALAVTGHDNTFYNYSREDGDWYLEGTQGVGNTLVDIIYHDLYGEFYMVGRSQSGNPTAWSFMASVGIMLGSPATGVGGTFNSIEIAENDGSSGYVFLAVGQSDDGLALAAWYDGGGWTIVSSGFTGVHYERINDVAWNHRYSTSSKHYLVGLNENRSEGIIYSVDIGSSMAYWLSGSWPQMGELFAIEWNPDIGVHDYALVAGATVHDVNVFRFNGSEPQPIHFTDQTINDISWSPDGSLAVLVGEYLGHAVVLHHYAGTYRVADLAYKLPLGAGPLYGVDVKAPSSPSSGLIVGPSGAIIDFPQATDTSSTVTVNAVFPKLYWIGFNDTDPPRTPRCNQQVSPDSSYYFRFVGNYSEGWANVRAEIRAWFDWGMLGDFSLYPPESPANRNLAFTVMWVPGSPPWVTFPGGALEIDVGAWSDTVIWGHPTDPAEDWHEVEMEVVLGAQIRAADGNGFLSGDPMFDQSPDVALQDPDSWDFNVTLRDMGNPTATNTSYGEFGIDKYITIMIGGNPSGNAPPGSSGVSLTGNTITYSSNTDYWVNVSIPNVPLGGVPGPINISATNFQVQNTHVDADPTTSDASMVTAFPGADSPLCVWGITGFELTPTGNGTTTAGPWRSNYNSISPLDMTLIDWWVTVPPSTQEGVYTAAITYSIETFE